MSDGRNELERAINVWEKRYAAAVRAKREAEVVMPFLRAAVEELDSFHAGAERSAPVAPVGETPEAESTPPPAILEDVAAEAPSPFDGNFAAADDADADQPADSEPTEFPSTFPRRAIASLMDEEDGDEAAIG